MYKCHTCGLTHEDVPMSFAADFPDMFANMEPTARGSRAIISSDQCIIDDTWFFVRGCLEVRIVDSDEVFVWGLWASVHQESFNEISEIVAGGRARAPTRAFQGTTCEFASCLSRFAKCKGTGRPAAGRYATTINH
jgi:hypothetical protein